MRRRIIITSTVLAAMLSLTACANYNYALNTNYGEKTAEAVPFELTENGLQVEFKTAEEVEEEKKAAEEASAEETLRLLKEEAESGNVDYEKAFATYCELADKGNGEAQNMVGNFYYSGKEIILRPLRSISLLHLFSSINKPALVLVPVFSYIADMWRCSTRLEMPISSAIS